MTTSKQVNIQDVRPGDSIVIDAKEYYIKNIYSSQGFVLPIVERELGKCLVLEYTDDKEKCNKNYVEPSMITVDELDFSVRIPSLWALKDNIDIKVED